MYDFIIMAFTFKVRTFYYIVKNYGCKLVHSLFIRNTFSNCHNGRSSPVGLGLTDLQTPNPAGKQYTCSSRASLEKTWGALDGAGDRLEGRINFSGSGPIGE